VKQFLLGLSTLIGMIIGGGIFALPYTFFKAGFLPSVFLLILVTFSLCLLHLFYLEIIQKEEKPHRFVGYIEETLGKKFKILASIFLLGSFWLSLLIYLILGANFLSALLKIDFHLAFFIFFFLGNLLIWLGLKEISLVQLFGSFFLAFIILFLFFNALPKIDFSFLSFKKISFSSLFLPYGSLLFSLYGRAAIPEVTSLVSSAKKQKLVVVLGTILPAILYLCFILTILGTSKEVFPFPEKNLSQVFGEKTLFLFNLFGFFSIFTSYLVIGLNLKETFVLDFSLPKILSFSLTAFVPLIFYFLGFKDFIKLIDFCGGSFLALNSLLLIFAYLKLKKRNYPKALAYFLILIFLFAFLWQILNLFKIA